MILVTGGTGLLGAQLLLQLTQKGVRVRALRRHGSEMNMVTRLFSYQPDANALLALIDWVEGDVLDPVSVELAMEGVHQVYHCAALVSFSKSDRRQLHRVNVNGTVNMVDAALKAGVDHFVYVSSIATLGSTLSGEPVSEGEPWDSLPKGSAYGHSKHAAEREVWRAMAEGLPAVIVNPSVILGPGDWNRGSCELFTIVDKHLRFFTRGINGYVDVRDVARAMVLLAESGIIGERFVVNGANVSYHELFEAIAVALKKPAPAWVVTPLMGEIIWRVMALTPLFTGRRPAITRETARSSQKKYSYSSQKLIRQTGMSFTPFHETIAFVASRFLSEHR